MDEEEEITPLGYHLAALPVDVHIAKVDNSALQTTQCMQATLPELHHIVGVFQLGSGLRMQDCGSNLFKSLWIFVSFQVG